MVDGFEAIEADIDIFQIQDTTVGQVQLPCLQKTSISGHDEAPLDNQACRALFHKPKIPWGMNKVTAMNNAPKT